MVKNTKPQCLFVIFVLNIVLISRSSINANIIASKRGKYTNDILKNIFSKWSTDVVQSQVFMKEIPSGFIESGFYFSKAEIEKLKLWPGGVISYYIDEFSFDKVLRDRIRSFLYATSKVLGSALQFFELPVPPADSDTRWVLFLNRQGQLGCGDHSIANLTNKGVQRVTLGYDCMSQEGELAEVVLMLAGIPAMHNAPDRDKYIKVEMDNIMPDKKYLFQAVGDQEWLFHGMEYDYLSASHYYTHKYTKSGLPTISLENSNKLTIGQYIGFSHYDIRKMRLMYNFMLAKQERPSLACDKLFSPGSNLGNTGSQFKKFKPLRKPNKYLGIPDNESSKKDFGDKEYVDAIKDSEQNKSIEDKQIYTEDNLTSTEDEKMSSKVTETILKGYDYQKKTSDATL